MLEPYLFNKVRVATGAVYLYLYAKFEPYTQGQVDKNHPTYTDEQLEQLLEHVFKHTDMNKDGYVDYLEYRLSNYKALKAQKEKQQAGAK
ncbi:hypothetical protein PYW07_012596 [Mythimna separata]|uniref:EF-hand domain-containing protein n=1 Tax=Mythimna separata TaxID=271217 RepID=A0AAD7Y8A2_MYTSE|nr:hypothetical protein PYW07_012596 [Mythimna separata]